MMSCARKITPRRTYFPNIMDKFIQEIINPLGVWSVTIAILGIIIWYSVKARSWRGPLVWPVVGYLPSLLFHFGHVFDWFTDLTIQKGGTFRFHGIWKSMIVTADPANIEYALRTKYHNFGKGEYYEQVFGDLFANSLHLEDGERFRELNRSCTTAITSAAFRNTAAAALPAGVHHKLLPLLRNAAEKGATIDLQDVFLHFAFDNTCTLGFGFDPQSLRADLPKVKFLEAFDGQ